MKNMLPPRGSEALELFCQLPVIGPVLDIGSGPGHHAAYMRQMGLEVVTLDSHWPADIPGVWPGDHCLDIVQYGGIWCCHVLEHSRNPGSFLDAIRLALRPGGWLAITVPPAKHNIAGGHLTLWNAGLLLYHLILAGFDCRDAMVKSYGYNISVIVKRVDVTTQPPLIHDAGDLESLCDLFPFNALQGFDGDIKQHNWPAL